MRERSCKYRQDALIAVDTILSGVLGPVPADVLYAYLERNFNIGKEEVHEEPDVFLECLQEIFGSRGARIIGKTILARLPDRPNVKTECEFVKALARLAEGSTRAS